MTKLALNYFFQKTCNLRQLDIRGIDNVGKSTFRVITEHVQKLEDLYLDVIYFKQMLLINSKTK